MKNLKLQTRMSVAACHFSVTIFPVLVCSFPLREADVYEAAIENSQKGLLHRMPHRDIFTSWSLLILVTSTQEVSRPDREK